MLTALDSVFTQRMADLQQGAKESAVGAVAGGMTKWLQLYTNKSSSTQNGVLDGFDNDQISEAFNRDELNAAYTKSAQSTEGITRDLQVAKMQMDILAGMERDCRMRYRSRIRMMAHAAARLKSQGLDIGPINKGIVNFVKTIVDQRDGADV